MSYDFDSSEKRLKITQQKKYKYEQWKLKLNDNGVPIKDLFLEKKNKKYNTYLYSYGILCSAMVDDEYKIILIKRQHTIGLLEFLRGKYELGNDSYFIKLLNMMTNSEKKMIQESNDFHKMRESVGLICKNSSHKLEYDDAYMKFRILKDKYIVDPMNNKESCLLDELLKSSTNKWDSQEWELPKGRKSNKEDEISCAVREFCEETGLSSNDIKVAVNVKPLDEIYTGINGVIYHHTYYFAEFIGDVSKLKFDNTNEILTSEVSEIKWASIDECNKLIRSYHQEKKALIRKYFQIIESKDIYFSELNLLK